MKKKFLLFSVTAIILFITAVISVNVSFGQTADDKKASTSSGYFGGWITKTEASEISATNRAGYNCIVDGETIDIKPLRGPKSYMIPSGTKNKTGYKIKSGQAIIGKYSGKTEIECPNDDPEIPPKYVTLDTIVIYATSKI